MYEIIVAKWCNACPNKHSLPVTRNISIVLAPPQLPVIVKILEGYELMLKTVIIDKDLGYN